MSYLKIYCTKFGFGWSCDADHTGGAPDSVAGFWGF